MSAAPELYDVKSVTKAAIGLMYAIHRPGKQRELLNMTSFYEQWSYSAFRSAVNRGVVLKEFAKSRMKPKEEPPGYVCL